MSLNGPAAARLYDEHVDAIYAYAARRVGPAAAVSVVEEVFEQALRKNAERPPHTSSDLGWLFAMATAFLRRHSEAECRRLKDWHPALRETSRVIPRVSDPLLSHDGEDPGATTTREVMAAIAELEPVERDVLFLVAWEGCSSALTATATGLPQSEIRPTLARIRKAIRRTMSADAPAARSSREASTTIRAAAVESNTPKPDPADRDAADPDPTEPDAAKPDPTEPDATKPDAADRDATKPDATEPDATKPDATKPDPTEPDATKPDATDPDATEPLDRSDDPLAAFEPKTRADPS